MFRNLKHFSEFSFQSARPVHIVRRRTETPAEEGEKEPEAKESLADLRDIVSANFEKHLRQNKEQIAAFIAECRKKPYQPGQWREWNKDFLRAMGYQEVSDTDATGVIRQLEYYLKERGSAVIVEGKLGPNGLSALERHIQSLEDNDGWVEGVTRMAFFTEFNQPVYLTYDGKWVDVHHKEVDLQTVLPTIATSPEPDELGYFTLKSETTKGKPTIYVDRNGAVYTEKPTTPGPEEWNIYEEVDEWDRRRDEAVEEAKKRDEKEREKTPESPRGPVKEDVSPRRPGDDFKVRDLIVKRPDGTYQPYYLTEDGKFLNEELQEISPSEVAQATYAREKDGEKEYLYEVDEGGSVAYYDKAGNRTAYRPPDFYKVEEGASDVRLAEADDDFDYSAEDLLAGFDDKPDIRIKPGPVRPESPLLPMDRPIQELKPHEVMRVMRQKGLQDVQNPSPNLYTFIYATQAGREIVGSIAVQSNGSAMIRRRPLSLTSKFPKETQTLSAFESSGELIELSAKDTGEYAKKYVAYENQPFIDTVKPKDVIAQLELAGFKDVSFEKTDNGHEHFLFTYDGIKGKLHLYTRSMIRFETEGDAERTPPTAESMFKRPYYLAKDMPHIFSVIARHIEHDHPSRQQKNRRVARRG